MKCLDCNKKMEEVWEDPFLVYECKNCIDIFDATQRKGRTIES